MITNNHLWGESWDIYRDKQVWVVGFRWRKDGLSSEHYHVSMVHTIFVSSGSLEVDMENSYDYLEGGDLASYTANQVHQLSFLNDTEGIETYYALPGHEIDPNDIVRLSPGRAPDAAPA
jgi:quercetin dioxygenase-like cupin family protein